MKKVIFALGLAGLLAGVAMFNQGSLTGTAQAQQPGAGTRVAVVNVGLVFTKYQKAMFYKTQLETTLKPYKDQGEKIVASMKQYAEPLKNGTVKDAKLKDQYEQYLLKCKRDMEDLDAQAKKLIGKQQEEHIITLFKDVNEAIKGFAKSNGYDLVLGYGQQIEGDIYSFQNINRIMQGMDLGSTTPLYFSGSIDISLAVVETLNAQYRQVQGTPTSQQK